jgi:chemotaxis protein CheD
MDQIHKISPRHSPVGMSTSSSGPSGVRRIRIFAGDVATSVDPAEIDTLLGSCVAVCLFDPKLRGGGMNHIMLPGNARDARSTRFGVEAMELLINDLMKKGGVKRRFAAKAFGGATVLPGLKFANVGDDNVKFVQDFLAIERIPLVAARLGGLSGVHVFFRTDTGEARVKSLDGKQLPRLIEAENSYLRAHEGDPESSGEITLF